MEARTTDFFLSAYLRLKGCKLAEMQNMEDNRKLFIFEDSKKFEELKRQYYFNEAQVDPLQYKQAIRDLKGLVMNH